MWLLSSLLTFAVRYVLLCTSPVAVRLRQASVSDDLAPVSRPSSFRGRKRLELTLLVLSCRARPGERPTPPRALTAWRLRCSLGRWFCPGRASYACHPRGTGSTSRVRARGRSRHGGCSGVAQAAGSRPRMDGTPELPCLAAQPPPVYGERPPPRRWIKPGAVARAESHSRGARAVLRSARAAAL